MAVGVAAIVAFVIGAVWNSSLLFGEALVQLTAIVPAVGAAMPAGQMLAELVRVLIVATVLALVLRIAEYLGSGAERISGRNG